jgi:tRNA uracil 4-sulfurtransferase
MHYIVKFFPEISIKSRPVRKQFVKKLRDGLRKCVKNNIDSDIRINSCWDYISIEANELCTQKQDALLHILQNTSGISFILEVSVFPFETLDDIVSLSVELFQDRLVGKSFVVRCKRKGDHEFTSHDAERYIGGGLLSQTKASGVNLRSPDVTVNIEIKRNNVYLVSKRFEGIGGYPVGSLGSVLSLISGGYDSPVASYMTMRRGMATHFCFFNLGGRAHEVGVKEVSSHLWSKYGMSHKVRFYTVPFEEVIAEILKKIDHAYMGVILKRMMIRAAQTIAKEKHLKALVTGEAVAQVSSQTIVNLSMIDNVSDMLVMRPLVTMDKSDIIDKAKEIQTAEYAEHMPEYCGVISVKPTTKAKLDKIEYEESKFDFSLLTKAINTLKDECIDDLTLDEAAEVEEFSFPVGDSVIVDIRLPDDRERKPLELSQKNTVLNIPFYDLSENHPLFDKNKMHCLFCDKGIMSRLHASLLFEKGFKNIAVYRPMKKGISDE